jgi:hypothetical protein
VYQTIEIPALRALTGPADSAARRGHVEEQATAQPRAGRSGLLTAAAGAGLIITAALVTILILIRAQHADGAALHALLSDPACAGACWAGIVPGVTSADEAVTLLEAHPWVDQVQRSADKISFWWNGQQPAILDDTGRAFHGRIELRLIDGVERVSSIVLATRAAFGTVQLQLGQPEALTLHAIAGDDDTRAGVVHIGHYPDRGITAFNLLRCPLAVTDFWNAPTYIAFGEPTLVFAGQKIEQPTYKLPDGFFAGRAPYCG